MDGKQKDTVESTAEVQENSETPKANYIKCGDCGRALSQQSGKCYYCGQADPEAIKNLNFVMLDWQQQAALDSSGRAAEKAQKNLSILFAISTAFTLGIGMTGLAASFVPTYVFILLGLLLGFMGWCFSFNSLTLLAAASMQAFCMFFFSNLGIKFLPKLLFKAGLCGFASSLSFLAVAIITYRIIKNKAIEL
jgi:hypothetical protein